MSSSHYISSLLTSQLYTIFSNNGYFFCKNHAEQKIYKINYTYWTKKLGLIWWIIKTFSFNFIVCRRRKLNLTLDILEKRLDMTQYDLSLVVKVPTQLNGYTTQNKSFTRDIRVFIKLRLTYGFLWSLFCRWMQ